MSLNKIYEIRDVDYYSSLTSDEKESDWTIPSVVKNSTFNYSNDGWKFGNCQYSSMILEIPFQNEVSIEFELMDYNNSSNPQPIIHILNSNTIIASWNAQPNTLNFASKSISHTLIRGATYKTVIESNKISLYENDNLLIDSSEITFPDTLKLRIDTGSNRYLQIRNIIIQKL